MKKIIIESVFGILFLVEGILVGFVYVQGGMANLLLIAFSVPSMLAGIVLLVIAGRNSTIDRLVEEKPGPQAVKEGTIVIDATKQQSMLERNNEIMNSWSKTYETREKMKMLKIAASASEQQNPS